ARCQDQAARAVHRSEGRTRIDRQCRYPVRHRGSRTGQRRAQAMNHPLATPPWGWWIGAYIVLTGLASGVTLVGRFMKPADDRAASRIDWASSWSSLAALAVCALILIVDLDRPARFFLMVTQFANPGSLMSWGAKIIALKIALLILHLMLLRRRRQAIAAGDSMLEDRATRALYSGVG